MKKLVIASFAGLVLFAACKKDDKTTTPTTPVKTKKDYLTEGKWQYSAFQMETTVKDPSNGIDNTIPVDYYAQMDACEKDDFMTFLSSGVLLQDEGGTKCNASDPQVDSSANWSINNDYSKLTLDYGADAMDADVVDLTASMLKVTYSEADTNGTTITSTKMVMTFKNIK